MLRAVESRCYFRVCGEVIIVFQNARVLRARPRACACVRAGGRAGVLCVRVVCACARVCVCASALCVRVCVCVYGIWYWQLRLCPLIGLVLVESHSKSRQGDVPWCFSPPASYQNRDRGGSETFPPSSCKREVLLPAAPQRTVVLSRKAITRVACVSFAVDEIAAGNHARLKSREAKLGQPCIRSGCRRTPSCFVLRPSREGGLRCRRHQVWSRQHGSTSA